MRVLASVLQPCAPSACSATAPPGEPGLAAAPAIVLVWSVEHVQRAGGARAASHVPGRRPDRRAPSPGGSPRRLDRGASGGCGRAGCADVAGTYIDDEPPWCPPTGLAVGLTAGDARATDARQPGVTAAAAADSPHPDSSARGASGSGSPARLHPRTRLGGSNSCSEARAVPNPALCEARSHNGTSGIHLASCHLQGFPCASAALLLARVRAPLRCSRATGRVDARAEAATIDAMANPDRLTALDTAFLHLEDDSHRAHARRLGDGVRGHRADATRSWSSTCSAACTSCRATASGWRTCRSARAGRCGPTIRTSTRATTSATPRCPPGGRGGAQAARRAAVLPAPGPLQAAVGDLARAAHGRRALRADRQDPPRARRRDLRRGHHDRAVRHLARARAARPRPPAPWTAKPLPGSAKLLGEALLERTTVPAEMGRGTRALLRAPRRAVAQVEGRPRERRRDHARRASARPRPPSPFNVDIGPHRRYTLVDAELGAVQGDQGLARRHAQRRRARLGQPRPRALPARAGLRHRGARAEGDGARLGARRRRSAARSATRSPRCGRRCRSASRTPPSACAQIARRDGGPEEVRPGRRRAGAHEPRRLRAAHDPQPGGAPAGAPALLQPRRHERPRPAVPAVPARPPPAGALPGRAARPRARRSGSP